jgi:RHS repeat-associated protein
VNRRTGSGHQEGPVGQPGTAGLPSLPTTSYEYDDLYDVVEKRVQGDALRETRSVYDAAGRLLEQRETGDAHAGQGLPAVRNVYDAATGRLAETQTLKSGSPEVVERVRRSYDRLGRLTGYTDSAGNVSSTSYDLLSRPLTTSDGLRTQTRAYDPVTGELTALTDSGVGSFTATYDADGQVATQTLPNGLLASSSYDETGARTALRYDKITNCTSGCSWLAFSARASIDGDWLTQTGTLSSQRYRYDAAGRLTEVSDTPAGQGCTVRAYSYDPDTNRTALATKAPGPGGACQPEAAGSTAAHSYDKADRLTDPGYTYDAFGRTLTVPAPDAGGQELRSQYYLNDLAYTMTQGDTTHRYDLDPMRRTDLRATSQSSGASGSAELTGGLEEPSLDGPSALDDGSATAASEPMSGDALGAEQPLGAQPSGPTVDATYHYADDSDEPTWIAEPGDWTRYVSSIGGDLAASETASGEKRFQLANLHGDVVAEASADPAAQQLLATFESDEFGVPRQQSGRRYGWLGAKQRSTEFASGAIQMGVRTYVPQIGRFTAVDPVVGGSANSYDYAEAEPINNLDLDGRQVDQCGVHGSARIQRQRGRRDIYRAEVFSVCIGSGRAIPVHGLRACIQTFDDVTTTGSI